MGKYLFRLPRITVFSPFAPFYIERFKLAGKSDFFGAAMFLKKAHLNSAPAGTLPDFPGYS